MELSEFLYYLIQINGSEPQRLPPLKQLSKQLGVGVSLLREQLEVAKAIGLVDVRPRHGIQTRPYKFSPAVNLSLSFALQKHPPYFENFLDLRRNIESAYLPQSIQTLQKEDFKKFAALIASAWEKLRGKPVRIPHQEHRQLHLLIYHRLENPFVTGLLEAYWDAYEEVGLNVYADLEYLEEVWGYHQRLIAAIEAKNVQLSQQLLNEHFDLLMDRLISR
jgi:DNA-binding FadR family transcriptional regulator